MHEQMHLRPWPWAWMELLVLMLLVRASSRQATSMYIDTKSPTLRGRSLVYGNVDGIGRFRRLLYIRNGHHPEMSPWFSAKPNENTKMNTQTFGKASNGMENKFNVWRIIQDQNAKFIATRNRRASESNEAKTTIYKSNLSNENQESAILKMNETKPIIIPRQPHRKASINTMINKSNLSNANEEATILNTIETKLTLVPREPQRKSSNKVTGSKSENDLSDAFINEVVEKVILELNIIAPEVRSHVERDINLPNSRSFGSKPFYSSLAFQKAKMAVIISRNWAYAGLAAFLVCLVIICGKTHRKSYVRRKEDARTVELEPTATDDKPHDDDGVFTYDNGLQKKQSKGLLAGDLQAVPSHQSLPPNVIGDDELILELEKHEKESVEHDDRPACPSNDSLTAKQPLGQVAQTSGLVRKWDDEQADERLT